jgi:hypothetical protein
MVLSEGFNPSAGKGSPEGGTFVCLFEGFKPEFWKWGFGGTLFRVCKFVCQFVCQFVCPGAIIVCENYYKPIISFTVCLY